MRFLWKKSPLLSMKPVLFLLIALTCFLLNGCSQSQLETPVPETEQEDSMTIALCVDSFLIERWEKDRDVFVSTARELGAEVIVQNANGDVEKQRAQIEYSIEKGVDAIVIVSIDGNALSDLVSKAHSRNIIVAAYDRMIESSNADLYISYDNVQVGALMGEALSSCDLPNRKVLMLQGSPTDHNVALIRQGFQDTAAAGLLKIVDSAYADGWNSDEAAKYLNKHLYLLDEVDAIMCGNDNIATAVSHVLSENQKSGEILLVGQDADLEACQRIVEGNQLMTVYKPVEKEAEAAARAVVSLIQREAPSGLTSTSDGKYGVPSIILDPISVTKENIDEVIIGNGFHLKEEVYANLLP